MSVSMEKLIENVWPSLKVEGSIGHGASGDVYRVRKAGMGRVYFSAVKAIQIPKNESEISELRTDGMDQQSIHHYFQDLVRQLSSEIDLMESLKSAPNIVSIEDFHVQKRKDRFGWIALIRMELLENLYSHIDRIGISENGIWHLAYDLCTALEYCGKLGVIHRDIKPANVFVTQFGDFKLGDFGISRKSGLSMIRSTKGTYAYMAPEVVRGQSYNRTVDLYSLGIMMYRYLNNNRLPYMPPHPAAITEHVSQLAFMKRLAGEPMEPPANGSSKMAEIVLKACAFESCDRFQSASEMKAALAEYNRMMVPMGELVIQPGTLTIPSPKAPRSSDNKPSENRSSDNHSSDTSSLRPAGDLSASVKQAYENKHSSHDHNARNMEVSQNAKEKKVEFSNAFMPAGELASKI